LVVPPALRAYAGIDRDAVSIGTLRRVEIWSKERLGTEGPSPDEAAAFTTELGLY
jgi:DNA-binding transcriptional regulator/RsmH inhibitor MraZ